MRQRCGNLDCSPGNSSSQFSAGIAPLHQSHLDSSSDSETVSVSEDEEQDARDKKWAATPSSGDQATAWRVLLGRYGDAKRKIKQRSGGSKNKRQRALNAIEVFCGCAELSAQLSELGIKSVGVDYSFNKDRPRATCFNVDLSTAEGQKLFWQMIEDNKPDYVHFAPPCGTASRARERPISKMFAMKAPQPLRSDDHPDGLANLSLEDKERVQAANRLYAFVALAVERLDRLGTHWTIENPSNSLFWATSWMVALKARVPSQQILFQHCMHGGTRDKRTTLWHSIRLNLALAGRLWSYFS